MDGRGGFLSQLPLLPSESPMPPLERCLIDSGTPEHLFPAVRKTHLRMTEDEISGRQSP